MAQRVVSSSWFPVLYVPTSFRVALIHNFQIPVESAWGSFYFYISISILAWTINQIPSKVLDKITLYTHSQTLTVASLKFRKC